MLVLIHILLREKKKTDFAFLQQYKREQIIWPTGINCLTVLMSAWDHLVGQATQGGTLAIVLSFIVGSYFSHLNFLKYL